MLKRMSDVSCYVRLDDKRVKCYGRISRIGKRPGFWFLKIRVGCYSDDIQVIVKKEQLDSPPTMYSTIHFTAEKKRSPDGLTEELHIEKILYYSPFDPADVEIEYDMPPELLRQKESQRLLTRKYQTILLAYDKIEQYLHEVSRKHGLLKIRAPFITFSDCEGGGETFELRSKIPEFFKKTAYLTVSGQVDEETVTSRLLVPTYIFGPSFRSDPSKTRWHACEFYHYEPEIPFIDLKDLMMLEESIIKGIISMCLDDDIFIKCLDYLKRDPTELKQFVEYSFAQISYTEAIKILTRTGVKFEVVPKWGDDLTKEHERYLCERHFGKPTFVYGYPSKIKSFYMLQGESFIDSEIDDEPLQICESVDLLVPGIGELCGGSIREHRAGILMEIMKTKGLDPKDYEEYLSLRQQGTFPHGGFGMGFDRFVMLILGVDHIRDVAPFPRYYKC